MIRPSWHSHSQRAEIELRYAADCVIRWRTIIRKTPYCSANATSLAPTAPTETNTPRSVNIDLANRTGPPMRLGSHVRGRIGIFLGRFVPSW